MIPNIGVNTNFNYNKRGQSFKASAPFARKNVNSSFKNIDANSADFIKYVYKKAKSMCNMPFEINVESGRILDIAQSNEPHIFVLNHTNKQAQDINGALFFNSLLYREYIYKNSATTCPRSKILAGEGFLKRSNMSDELKFMGVVPINAKANNKEAKSKNRESIQDIVEKLVSGKINFFIFPEGAMSMIPFLPLKYKFQAGVSSIIKKVLEQRDNIKVVPIAFAHNKQGSSIHIGESIKFSKKGNEYYASKGNVDSKFFNTKLKNFYNNKDEILLTNRGQAVNSNEIVPYISGILSENLDCCIKEAKNDLKHSSGKVFVI